MSDVKVIDRIDPALKKLLDELPAENPDPEETAEVWVPWCKGSHIIPIDVEVSVWFGEWFGPKMNTSSMPFFARFRGETRGRNHPKFSVEMNGFDCVRPHDLLSMTLIFRSATW